MVNKNLLNAGKIIVENKAKEAEERKANLPKSVKGLPKVLNFRANEPVFVSPLVEDALDLTLHIEYVEPQGKRRGYYSYSICNEFYKVAGLSSEDCEKCLELDGYGNPKKTTDVKVLPVYVHSYEGKVFVDPQSGQETPYGTEKILIVRPGKSKANFSHFDTLAVKGAFTPGKFIFEVKKVGEGKDTQYMPLTVTPTEFLGDEFDPASSQFKAALKKWSEMTEDQIYQAKLHNFIRSDAEWELWGVDVPKANEVESITKTDSAAKGKKSKNALED